MNLSRVLEQAWPILLLQLLLSQYHLDVRSCMMCLRVLRVNFTIEFELDMIGSFLGLRSSREGELGGCKVELERFWRHVGDAYCEVDVVLLSIGGRGSLRP